MKPPAASPTSAAAPRVHRLERTDRWARARLTARRLFAPSGPWLLRLRREERDGPSLRGASHGAIPPARWCGLGFEVHPCHPHRGLSPLVECTDRWARGRSRGEEAGCTFGPLVASPSARGAWWALAPRSITRRHPPSTLVWTRLRGISVPPAQGLVPGLVPARLECTDDSYGTSLPPTSGRR